MLSNHRTFFLANTSIALVLSIHSMVLAADAPQPTAPTASASDQTASTVGLPKAYESIVLSLATLSASGSVALKTKRSDERSLAIRSSLSKKLLSHSADPSIVLDSLNKDATLSEVAILCDTRKHYIQSFDNLNYLTSLVSQLTEISKPAPKPGDLPSALKLLFATSGYSISDQVSSSESDHEKQATSVCLDDLKSYDTTYYGAEVANIGMKAEAPTRSLDASSFAFLGPYGVLIDSFVAILQPLFIQAATIVDDSRRRAVIVKALQDDQQKIHDTSEQLASEVDTFALNQRRELAGSFVEQLVAIREKPIDLSKMPECQGLQDQPHLSSGAPSAAFISCWRASWAQLEPQVTNLLKTGDDYDAVADAGNVTAEKKIGTILADYAKIHAGKADASDVFSNDVTQFVAFLNAISNAASNTNISNLKKAISTVYK